MKITSTRQFSLSLIIIAGIALMLGALSLLSIGGFFRAAVLKCGNGLAEIREECDDGNAMNFDGCTNGCRILTGWTCTGSISICHRSCGNGVVQKLFGEECDDGNVDEQDGCNRYCRIEKGFSCEGAPSNCRCAKTPQTCGLLHCGDGLLDPGEQCDDRNLSASDGCDGSCAVETGYVCKLGSPSVCSRIPLTAKPLLPSAPPETLPYRTARRLRGIVPPPKTVSR